LTDPNFEHWEYDPIEAYGASKTANALFAVEFDRRHKQRGVRAAAVHPGNIFTELARHMSQPLTEAMTARAMADMGAGAEMVVKSIPQGAATTVWAAVTAPAELVAGRFCQDCAIAQVAETGSGVRPYAIDTERAKALWARSEEIVGERFPAA
jgi:NAD(P)-dependent dehydrogenase (short-subunit alcohol dehydrogenase family)